MWLGARLWRLHAGMRPYLSAMGFPLRLLRVNEMAFRADCVTKSPGLSRGSDVAETGPTVITYGALDAPLHRYKSFL